MAAFPFENTMTYKLFIDDERNPVTDDWVIARTSQEACEIVWNRGIPNEIAFDHDLGGEDTTRVFLNWFLHLIIDFREKLPEDFKWSVHSQNPIGAKFIKEFMGDLERVSSEH